jgi:putative endonuclease
VASRRVITGRSAEIAAAAELGRRGYRIIASNYRCRQGEIDFVADDSGVLVFVEVRCKTTDSYGSPAESITQTKMRRLGATAEHWIYQHGEPAHGCRFDVVEITRQDGKLVVREIIKDAFTM